MKPISPARARIAMLLMGVVWVCGSAVIEAVENSETEPRVDFYSIIEITFAKNLEIAAARFNIEATDYQFRRFERNLSQFVPLIVEAVAGRDSESFLDGGNRLRQNEDEAAVSLGFEKEFFDGKRIPTAGGMRGTSDDDGENSHPFFGGELQFPLFSSFTTLERVTERNFEESELINAWLDFIDTVRGSISESHEAYVEVEKALGMRLLTHAAIQDFQSPNDSPLMGNRENDRLQVKDQIQAFQYESVEFQGEVDSAFIGLLETLGLEEIRPLEMNGEECYGRQYIESDIEALIQDAIQNDVEIRVLEIARSNAELKKRLAKQGKWDIIGKLFGNYDFARRGDDRRRREGYEVGLGMSVQWNDPKLLLLSMRQAEAEIRRFDAQIKWRGRQVHHLIKRKVSEARSLRDLIEELKTNRALRRSVYTQKLEAFLAGMETIDNLIQARASLFDTEKDLAEGLAGSFEIVIELDVASGFYLR